MADFVLQSNHVIQINANTLEDSDSSNDDVFIDFAQAWDVVKKWYKFSKKTASNNDFNVSRVKFTKCSSRNSRNKLKINEPQSRKIFFHDLPVSAKYAIVIKVKYLRLDLRS